MKASLSPSQIQREKGIWPLGCHLNLIEHKHHPPHPIPPHPHPLDQHKKTRWTSRGRTWGTPPCSSRALSQKGFMVWVKVNGPVGNPESSWVHKKKSEDSQSGSSLHLHGVWVLWSKDNPKLSLTLIASIKLFALYWTSAESPLGESKHHYPH